MRLFEREANFIRETAYQDFKRYRMFWDYIRSQDYVEDYDCPEATRAYNRAMNLESIANLLDPQSKYNFWARYREELKGNTFQANTFNYNL